MTQVTPITRAKWACEVLTRETKAKWHVSTDEDFQFCHVYLSGILVFTGSTQEASAYLQNLVEYYN